MWIVPVISPAVAPSPIAILIDYKRGADKRYRRNVAVAVEPFIRGKFSSPVLNHSGVQLVDGVGFVRRRANAWVEVVASPTLYRGRRSRPFSAVRRGTRPEPPSVFSTRSRTTSTVAHAGLDSVLRLHARCRFRSLFGTPSRLH